MSVTSETFANFFGSQTDQFDQWLQDSNAVVAGGSICNLVAGIEVESSDLDIYIPLTAQPMIWPLASNFGLQLIGAHLQSPYDRSFLRQNGIGLRLSFYAPYVEGQPRRTIDVMVCQRPVLEVVSNFDLTCAQCWYDGRAIGGTHLEETRARRATLNGLYLTRFMEGNMFTVSRLKKYIERGFTITINPPTGDIPPMAENGIPNIEEFLVKFMLERWTQLYDLTKSKVRGHSDSEASRAFDLDGEVVKVTSMYNTAWLGEGREEHNKRLIVSTARKIFCMANNYTVMHFLLSTGMKPDRVLRLLRYVISFFRDGNPDFYLKCRDVLDKYEPELRALIKTDAKIARRSARAAPVVPPSPPRRVSAWRTPSVTTSWRDAQPQLTPASRVWTLPSSRESSPRRSPPSSTPVPLSPLRRLASQYSVSRPRSPVRSPPSRSLRPVSPSRSPVRSPSRPVSPLRMRSQLPIPRSPSRDDEVMPISPVTLGPIDQRSLPSPTFPDPPSYPPSRDASLISPWWRMSPRDDASPEWRATTPLRVPSPSDF